MSTDTHSLNFGWVFALIVAVVLIEAFSVPWWAAFIAVYFARWDFIIKGIAK